MNAPCYKDSPRVGVKMASFEGKKHDNIQNDFITLPDPKVSPNRPCCEGWRRREDFETLAFCMSQYENDGDGITPVPRLTCKSCYFYGGNHESNG